VTRGSTLTRGLPDGSKAKEILERMERSKKEKGAAGQGSRKESGSNDRTNQKAGEGKEETTSSGDDSDDGKNEKHDEEDEVDKGPSICSVDQSAITGESLAVDKFHGEIVYYTTTCKRGKCYARSMFFFVMS
jgi:H+-transporting ATPase